MVKAILQGQKPSEVDKAKDADTINGKSVTELQDFHNLTNKPNGLTTGESFEVTLSSSAWQQNKQTITNAKFLAADTQNYIVGPKEDSYVEYTNNGVRAHSIPSNGSMVFACNDVPSSQLMVEILRLEVATNG